MKVAIKKAASAKEIEEKINKCLEELEAEGQKIRSVNCSTLTVPKMHDGEIISYDIIYHAMIGYEPDFFTRHGY